MKTIICPRCGASIATSRAFRPTIKPFCARCGWNLQRAELAAGGKSAVAKVTPIAIAAVVVFVALGASKAHSVGLLFVVIAVGTVMLLPYWAFVSARKEIAAAKLSADPSLARAQPIVDPMLQQLQTLPRPRRVRFRVPSGIVVVILIAFLLAIGGTLVVFLASPSTRGQIHLSGILVVPIVLAVLVVFPYFRDRRNAALMRDGEMALARVMYQENVQAGKSTYSRIGYEFKTNAGQLIQDQAKDVTYTVYEDMTIPVFYDPLSPAKNVTPCATYLQLSSDPY